MGFLKPLLLVAPGGEQVEIPPASTTAFCQAWLTISEKNDGCPASGGHSIKCPNIVSTLAASEDDPPSADGGGGALAPLRHQDEIGPHSLRDDSAVVG